MIFHKRVVTSHRPKWKFRLPSCLVRSQVLTTNPHEQFKKQNWLFKLHRGLILPSYIGIIINHENTDPYEPTRFDQGFKRKNLSSQKLTRQVLEPKGPICQAQKLQSKGRQKGALGRFVWAVFFEWQNYPFQFSRDNFGRVGETPVCSVYPWYWYLAGVLGWDSWG